MQSLLPLVALAAWGQVTLMAAASSSAAATATAVATRVGNATDDARAQITSKVHTPEDFALDDDSEERGLAGETVKIAEGLSGLASRPLSNWRRAMEAVKKQPLPPKEMKTFLPSEEVLPALRTLNIPIRQFAEGKGGKWVQTGDDSWRTAFGVKEGDRVTDATEKVLENARAAIKKHAETYNPKTRKTDLSQTKDEKVLGEDGKILAPLVGRENQIYLDKDKKIRVVTCSVVVDKEGKVLLISSSNPGKIDDWLLPKGGLERTDETVPASAERELLEEAGVTSAARAYIGPRYVEAGAKDKYYMHVFKVESPTKLDKWAENKRQRIWVPYADAIRLLRKKRPHLAEFVYEASKVKATETVKHALAPASPKLSAN
ncbi:unnamed protein product [Hyaloperonospora brassicae]|uniref:Nudix hydrolase domain-containing protein n=1 Tax=Hyaloperonospora brassicae TaxID=162125 RepID=A0AAV0U7K5_HYABA|nr:unnamed protein product [Hyaloperonospora brassicae]